MATPKWQAGHLYQPGDLVVPATSAPITSTAIENPNFVSGNTDWTLPTSWTIGATGSGYAGSGFVLEWGNLVSGTPGAVNDVRAPVTPGQTITAKAVVNTNGHTPSAASGNIQLVWYDSGGSVISFDQSNIVHGDNTSNWRVATVNGVAPDLATHVSVGAAASRSGGAFVWFGGFTWDYAFAAPADALTFEATQANAAYSAASEPVWPVIAGGTVVDGGVTWEGVTISRLSWTAIPITKSGGSEPTWPTAPGGVVVNGTVKFIASVRQITDDKCPNSKIVVLGASKIFAGDDDIVPFCATTNPFDWSTTNDAGFLPVGLQNYGQNPTAAMSLYRGNLAVFNSGGYQVWQIDPDPQNMAILDAEPVGSTYHKAMQGVANDLLMLTAVGVRDLSIAGGSTNLQAGGVGNPIDSLVNAAVKALTGTDEPISLYNTGRGQYWLICDAQAFVLTSYGPGQASWSRYVFSETITDWTLLNNDLYLRTASNKVWKMDESVLSDDVVTATVTITIANPGVVTLTAHGCQNGDTCVLHTTGTLPTGLVAGTTYYLVAKATNTFELAATPGGTPIHTTGSQSGVHTAVLTPAAGLFQGVMWWPYIDAGALGGNKSLIGFDVIGTGQVAVSVGYDERDFAVFTAAYTIDAADTVPGTPIPLPVTAPSYSLQLTFAANQAWQWNAANLYFNDGKPYAPGAIG